ncbi:MAG TPA: PEP-CTERM sorting domain-containing protein [Kiloniellaceae bacterium]
MKRVISAALLASAILLTATAAKAVPLFENPFPSTDWGIGPCSSCFGIGRAWDSFTLGADSKISQIDSDLIFIGDVSTINYSIWDASLTTEIFSQTFTPGVDMALVPAGWRFTASIVVPDLLLGPGDYYLSIYDPQATESMLWTLAPTLDGSGFLTFLEHPDSHTLWDGYDLAFRIIGSTTTAIAVPEPATVLPFLFGLAGIGLLARRKRKRDHR